MTVKNNFLTILLILFCRVNTTFSQEWEYLLEIDSSTDERFNFYDAVELSNGNIGISSEFYYRSGYGDFYSAHPAVVLLSSDGVEIARKSFFREGYTSMSYAPYLFENNGDLYALSTYSPEHDYTCPNYFLNYDNPPTDAKLVLSKLDNKLNLLESYEHSFPIDTFEDEGWGQWDYMPNEYSGNIFLFSAFEDDGNIIGAYHKTVSADHNNPRGNDSLFIFKMNFEGTFVNIVGYERDTHGIGWPQAYFRRNQMVKTDSHYILYELFNKYNKHGRVLYFDKELNHVATKYISHPDYVNTAEDARYLMDISVVKGNNGVTYLSTTARCIQNPHHYLYDDVRLYKFNDNLENSSDFLPIDNYIIRGKEYTREMSPNMRAVDVAFDNTLYFACNYNIEGAELWSVIEQINYDLDTITTYFWDKSINSIKTTKDGKVLINNGTYIAKIPGTVNIEEAHAHNLKLAVAYPNPGGDVMNIRTGLRNAILSVYDIQGRKVHEQEITDEVTSIDASKWESGTYVWELRAGNGIFENGSGSGIFENGSGSGNEIFENGNRIFENGNRIFENGKWVK